MVFARQYDLFSQTDAQAIEQAALDDGYRFDFSATVSLESEPDKYKQPERAASALLRRGRLRGPPPGRRRRQRHPQVGHGDRAGRADLQDRAGDGLT